MKTILILLLFIFTYNLFGADTIKTQPNGSAAYLVDNAGNLLPLAVAYTTDGNGTLSLLGSSASITDNIFSPKNTGKMFLKAADSKTYPAMVLYTTDGNGNIKPIPAGAAAATWGSITGTLSSQTDLQTALGLKADQSTTQAALNLKAPLADQSTYKVGPGRQYTTIQSALNAIGNSTSSADSASPKLVSIAGGVYDEDLVIPLGRILTLQAEGTVVLGNGAGSNWSSTNTRSISADYNTADVFTSGVRPALNIVGLPGADATSTFLAHAGTFNISGNITITGALTRSLNLSSVKLNGTLTDTSVGLTNLQAYRTLFVGAVNMGTVAILERCYDCEFDALLTVNSFNAIINSEIKAGMTVTANSNTLPPSGMFFTTFTGTFTGPASSLKLDAVSDYFFRVNGGTLAGSATKVIIRDTVIPTSVSGSKPTCSATNRGLMWNTDGGAGVADVLQICLKDSANAYNWVTK